MPLRKVALMLHRYVGLALAVFLIVSGLTGSLLAFHHEIDTALNPELFRVSQAPLGARVLSPLALRDRALALAPSGATISSVNFDTPPNEAVAFYLDLPSERRGAGADDEYFLDPYTGDLKGSRRWGDLRQGRRGFMPFVYRLHSSLALGEVGEVLLGIVALLWTLDCFVGAYLTFPVSGPPGSRDGNRAWFGRWKRAWLLKTTRLFSLIFTWHRASGLWVWGMLFVFAWSGVSLNLHDVYEPTMHALVGPGQSYDIPELDAPVDEPKLSFFEAHKIAATAMDQEARARDFVVLSERSLRYRPASGVYEYRVYSSRDISQKYANTTIWIDGDSGERRGAWLPTGESASETLSTWLYQLHFGTIDGGGFLYRVFISIVGIAVCVLSGTGVWIWWNKVGSPNPKSRSENLSRLLKRDEP